MKKIFFLTSLLFFFALASIAFAQENKPSFTYFYADWCPHCQNVNDFFMENGVYEKYDVEKLNFDELKNKIKLKNIFDEKGYGNQTGIPPVITDGELITGDQPIIDFFKGRLKEFKPEKGNLPNNFTLIALIAAAFVDASNPCAMAVLVLLLATVIASKGKNQALLSGLAFSLAIFMSYFLMGIGFYKAISAFSISRYLSLGAGVLSIIVGLANLKDAFWHGKVFVMEVPFRWRPKLQSIIKGVTSPIGAFGVGFIVSLFLVPCASGPYIVILGMIAGKTGGAIPFFLLALYNLIFVLPMLIITFAMYFFNTRMGKLDEWRKSNLQLLHAVAGVIMLLLGVYLIYSRI